MSSLANVKQTKREVPQLNSLVGSPFQAVTPSSRTNKTTPQEPMARTTRFTRLLVLVGLVIAMAQHAVAAEWGTLKGKFVYGGSPPIPAKIDVNTDVAVCTEHHPVDESLVVDKKGGLARYGQQSLSL